MREAKIFWIDARTDNDNVPIEVAEGMQPYPRENKGWIVKDNESEIVIAFGLIRNSEGVLIAYDMPTVIPRGLIVKIEEE